MKLSVGTKLKEIQKDWIERSVEKDCLDYQLIRSATIIAGTCIGFLANSFVKDMEFDYVIIDEAAKATTPELLVSIIKAKKLFWLEIRISYQPLLMKEYLQQYHN